MYLLTGGTGFIGKYFIEAFIKNHPTQSLKLAVMHKEECTNIHLYNNIDVIEVGRISEQTDWAKALKDVHCVIHLAGRAHILHDTAENPEDEFMKVNHLATKNLAEQAVEAGVQQFIFMSSLHAVAASSNELITEKTIPNPITPYGRSKLEGEKALKNATVNSSSSYTILRPSLVYGIGNKANMDRLIKLVNSGLPLPFGSVKNKRSFIYVENLVDIILTCVDNTLAFNQTFVLGDSPALSTPELIQLIASSFHKKSILIPIPALLISPFAHFGDFFEKIFKRSMPINTRSLESIFSSLAVDCSFIYKQLGWKQPYTISEALKKSVELS